jgi:Leucine-rich repeat (LRR) protein
MAALANMGNLFRSSRGSGVLNLQGRELKEVPREVIKPFDNLAADEKAFAVVLLSRLNLNDNELQSLPEDINEIGEELKRLELKNNALTSLPSAIGLLVGLSVLDLSGNQLVTLPPEIGRLMGLGELNVKKNALTSLPDTLDGTPEAADLRHRLRHAYATTRHRHHHRHLLRSGLLTCGVVNCANNKLTELPPSLGRMAALRALIADHNVLTSLPDMSGNEALEKLEVMHNRLASLRLVSGSGRGVCFQTSHDFRLLPTSSSVSCSRKLPLSSTVSHRLPMSTTRTFLPVHHPQRRACGVQEAQGSRRVPQPAEWVARPASHPLADQSEPQRKQHHLD